MKDTSQFVHDLEEKQRKDIKNKQKQGDDAPAKKLPNHKHWTDRPKGVIFLLVGCKAIIGSFSEDMKGI